MKLRVPVLICVIALCVLALTAAVVAQNSQAAGASQKTPAGVQKTAAGEKTVTGCVVREGEGFVLKTDEGTYEFDTARDLTPYVGKKVRISGQWKATGVATTAPIKATATSGEQGSSESAPAKKAGAPQSFSGDFHLHITGNVIGDCAEQK